MKKVAVTAIFILVLFAAFFASYNYLSFRMKSASLVTAFSARNVPAAESSSDDFQSPMERAGERITKKPFGIFVAPGNSPVDPERFEGYHTAIDFETFSEEQDTDVPVRAVCGGRLLAKKRASGYGGVAVQACELANDSITVIYGHLDPDSIRSKVGDNLSKGDFLGNLGKGHSDQTDGERKHLHLGFHRGNLVNILGYVNSREELSDWIDPCPYVCK